MLNVRMSLLRKTFFSIHNKEFECAFSHLKILERLRNLLDKFFIVLILASLVMIKEVIKHEMQYNVN